METAQLKGVSVGAGYFSHYHFDAWNRIPEVTIVALCDVDRTRAEEQMKTFGIDRYYNDFREMIDSERPDFVDIITPPPTHLEICQYAAERGTHILCQKPLAPSLEESRQIVEAAAANGVRFMVNENWRWQPWYREIKKILTDGRLGQIALAYFQMRMGDGWGEDAYLDRQPFFREYEKLLIYEVGVHFIDTFRFLFGEIERVFAQLSRLNPVIKGEDSGQVFFQFCDGTRSILDASRYNENDSGVNLYTCSPRNTFGVMRLDGLKGHLIMDSCGDLIIKPLGKDSYHHAYNYELSGFAGDSCYAALKHFSECMVSGEEFETNGRDYLRTLEVVDACYDSAETGLPVDVSVHR